MSLEYAELLLKRARMYLESAEFNFSSGRFDVAVVEAEISAQRLIILEKARMAGQYGLLSVDRDEAEIVVYCAREVVSLSGSIGEYLSRRLSVLREWKNLIERVVQIIKESIPDVEVYVFGSIVTERITGSSDLDILVVVPNNLRERDIHTCLSLKLEEILDSTSYIVDLHVVRRENLNKPPYIWWIKRALRVD